MDLIVSGRRVNAHEALRFGLCEYVVPHGQARAQAEELAHTIAGFPQSCLRADRRSARTVSQAVKAAAATSAIIE
jgi:enoyl-CoA hydratase